MRILFIIIGIFFFTACTNESNSSNEKTVKEIKATSTTDNAALIRNPISMNEPLDTVNVAKIKFEQATYDFGSINEGDIIRHEYTFTNTGKIPLVITNASSTCGCTVPEWPKDPIPPGKGGTIKVKFDSTNKKDKQAKPVSIIANTFPNETKIYLKGFVKTIEN